VRALRALLSAGHSVVVIEHNLGVIRAADWIVDLGPEGGHRGGRVIAEGTPEDVAAVEGSATGEYLARVLRGEPLVPLSDVTFADEAGRAGTRLARGGRAAEAGTAPAAAARAGKRAAAARPR
jgi:excinuclease ABC subunit A